MDLGKPVSSTLPFWLCLIGGFLLLFGLARLETCLIDIAAALAAASEAAVAFAVGITNLLVTGGIVTFEGIKLSDAGRGAKVR